MLDRYIYAVLCIYALLILISFLNTHYTVYFPRREFTSKELYNGPLVMREGKVKGLNHVVIASDLNSIFAKGKKVKKISTVKKSLFIEKNILKDIGTLAKELVIEKQGFIYFMFVNDAFIRLTLNFLCNTAFFDHVHERLMIVGTTASICKSVTEKYRNVVCSSINFDGLDEAAQWGSPNYKKILLLRMKIMTELVQKNIKFALIEPDAVWFQDPYVFFQQSLKNDLTLPIKGKFQRKNDSLSFDPMLVNPTFKTKKLFEKIVVDLDDNSTLYDQDLLNKFCAEKYKGTICGAFSWENIADGEWFKLTEKQRLSYSPLIVNNNFYVGVKHKESRQALNGFWFTTSNGTCLPQRVNSTLTKYGSPPEMASLS